MRTYLNPASIVSFVECPSSFSSRLIRVTAAERPMKTAKRGSPILEMRWAGGGITVFLIGPDGLMIDKGSSKSEGYWSWRSGLNDRG